MILSDLLSTISIWNKSIRTRPRSRTHLVDWSRWK